MVIKGLMDFDSSWYLCVLERLTKTQTKFKPYQDTRNQRTLNSWTNFKDQKVSSECWSVSWSERFDGSLEGCS